MIQVKKSYVVELSEEQARQLYKVLQSAKSQDQFTYGSSYDELGILYDALKNELDCGIR